MIFLGVSLLLVVVGVLIAKKQEYCDFPGGEVCVAVGVGCLLMCVIAGGGERIGAQQEIAKFEALRITASYAQTWSGVYSASGIYAQAATANSLLAGRKVGLKSPFYGIFLSPAWLDVKPIEIPAPRPIDIRLER